MRTAAALRQEVQGLRQAIEDIKRDLPISSSYEEPSEEELMSFRPAKPAVRELGTETEGAWLGKRQEKTVIERDLEDIKGKIDALKTSFQQRQPDSPGNSTFKPDFTRESASRGRQDRLIDELARLQEENKALKAVLATKSQTVDTTRRKSVKMRTKKKGESRQCENCAFLRSKGFESDLCYRHRMKSLGKSLKKR